MLKRDDSSYLPPKALAALFLRTWPYLRPQWRHLIALVGLMFASQGVLVGAGLIGFDVFNNKVLVGEKLEPAQAALLRLGADYVRSPATEDITPQAAANASAATGPGEQLTTAERRVVRNRLMVVFGIAGILLLSLGPLSDYYRTWIMQRINQSLRVRMIEKAEHLSLRYHSHARTGDAIYRVFQDSAMITSVVNQAIIFPLETIGYLVFSYVMISIFSPTIGFVFLVGALPVVWFVAWFTPQVQWRSQRARETNSALTSRIQEAFAAIRIVKANVAEHVMADRFDRDSTMALNAAFYFRLNAMLMWGGVVVMTGLLLVAAWYLMASWTIAAEPTFAAGAIAVAGFAVWNLGAFEFSRARVNETMGYGHALAATWSVLQDMAKGLERAFLLLDLEREVVEHSDARDVTTPIREIAYANVRFGYQLDTPILLGASLTARVGTVTAIVGASGAGKTTLTSLLLRLYDPDAGAITINGTDLRELKVASLRASIATALQQNVLFAASVADNIAYAREGSTRREIESAARVACADEFIRAMPHGYDTELGERGSKLSTGQRQRLSIARAVVRDTPILILDEPTASLDAETEHRVLENLGAWGRERIVFLITHRLSTIRSADQIVFLDDGVVKEQGTHEELLARNGAYWRLVHAETVGSAQPEHQIV